jgi:hypothetical protein
VDAITVTLSELGTGVPLTELAELVSTLSQLPDKIEVIEHGRTVATFGPPIEAVVVDDGSPPFAKRVTVNGLCGGCERALARYTGGLRLTMSRPKLAGVEVRLVGDMFVFDCQNPQCRVPPKRWPYHVLAAELRKAWDEGSRRFVLT